LQRTTNAEMVALSDSLGGYGWLLIRVPFTPEQWWDSHPRESDKPSTPRNRCGPGVRANRGEVVMSERVFAVVTMYENPDLLVHFLDHYARLGVYRILVSVRTAEQGDLYDSAVSQATHFQARVYWESAQQFADSDKAEVEQAILEKNGVGPDDYVMHLDMDEFHEYPASLAEIVRIMNRRDAWALRGWMVDRVAEDGALAPIRPSPSIGEQFPIGCDLTGSLLKGWTQKIVLCRGRVRLQGGVNHDTCNALYDDVPIGDGDQYLVHHFKWMQGVDERLRTRLAHAAIAACYSDECRRFLDHYEARRRIDVRSAALRPRWLGALKYPG